MEKDVFTKKLGKRIAKVRTDKELTQVQLGKLLNKPKQNIYRLEVGIPQFFIQKKRYHFSK